MSILSSCSEISYSDSIQVSVSSSISLLPSVNASGVSKSSVNNACFDTSFLLSEKSWFSQDSPCETSDSSSVIPIQVTLGHRPPKLDIPRPKPVRRTVRRDNKCFLALGLPVLTSYNMRSLWPKIHNLAADIHEREADVSFLCEVWEKKENPKHKKKLEEMLEMSNIKYISTPRPGAKRGGGAAIAINLAKCNVEKLNVHIPKPLEVVWAILKSNLQSIRRKNILLCSFYSPPNSRKNGQLIDHIAETYNQLKIQHPEAAFILSGDKNDLDVGKLLAINPSFSQIVTKNTRKENILTVIITDLKALYHNPIIIPPIEVDMESDGVPSDHSGVLAVPVSTGQSLRKPVKTKTTVRPMPESLINKFGEALTKIDWSILSKELEPSEMVRIFEDQTQTLINNTFPSKTVTMSDFDKPFITEELKKLKRCRQRVYRKHGRSEKYLELKKLFDQKLKNEAEKYRQKILRKVMEGTRISSYGALRKLEQGEYFHQSKVFTLPNHEAAGLSPLQSAEKLADFFSCISQEFSPLDVQKCSPKVKALLVDAKTQKTPVLQPYEVYARINKSKKPGSTIPGDLPVKLVKEFAVELAEPVCKIFNNITSSAKYPRQWVNEYQIAIPKILSPQSEDDLRNIASTAYFSKIYESFIGDWIFPFIGPYIDPAQCGGLKGSSITHYLIRLLHFVHMFADMREPHAVLLALIDLEKAFNRVSHQIVIEDLADMNVPGWLLAILTSYLSDRCMYMRYKGATSSRRSLPGSTPQGAFLGILLFIIIFNGALLRPSIPRPYSLHLKYIDDLSVLAAISLKDLVSDPVNRPLPPKFDERYGTILPTNNLMQTDLDSLAEFAVQKELLVKERKTYVMKFNFKRNYDFPPDLKMQNFDNELQVIDRTKLLGIVISNDLKWDGNTEYLCQRAYKKLWVLRRLKSLDVDPLFILDVYQKEVRSILELAVPAWHSGLTDKLAKDLERVQRVAVRIILGYVVPYDEALEKLNLDPLSVRREKLCRKFAKKTLSSRHSSLFSQNQNIYKTRHREKFHHPICRTKRFFDSPVNFLTRILNTG